VSIAAIIPLYNGAPFIREALESVFRQTIPVDEIIVVNDGSTDDGPDIVRAMAADRPIRLLEQPNRGQSAARNLAAANTSCRYLALLDQDDIWLDDHNEILLRSLAGARGPAGMAYGNLHRIDAKGHVVQRRYLDVVGSPQPKNSRADCLRANMMILPGATLIDREAFLRLGGFDERLSGYEDDDLFHRMFAAGYDLLFVDEPVTLWRIHKNSSSFRPSMARSRMVYFQKLVEAYPDEPEMGLFWTRDVFAPRFFADLRWEVIVATRAGDRATVERAWKDIQVIAPFLRRRQRRRTGMIAPIMNRLGPATSLTLTRKLVRWATG